MYRIENHLFLIWPWANKKLKIERYIEKNFHVLYKFFTGHVDLGEFYGIKSDITATNAVAYVVRTEATRAHRPTSTGFRQVNPTMFDTKQQLRKWGGKHNGLNSVHGTDDPAETQRNLLELAPRYDTLAQVLSLLPQPYVWLRNFHGEPDHSDIDIMVESLDDITQLHPIKVDAYGKSPALDSELKYKYLVRVGGELVNLDLRYVGDGYFDPAWQQQVLDNAIKENYYYRPTNEDWYWTLLYHAHFHKGTLDVYGPLLKALDKTADHSRESVVEYMRAGGFQFTAPDDPVFVHFNLLKGRVADGAGMASKEPSEALEGEPVRQPGLVEKWERGAGYKPYPGTFNVEIAGNFQLPKPAHTEAVYLFNKQGEPTAQVPMYFWPALINGQEVTLTYGDERFFQPNQVEILAPVNLRNTLGLETGDDVSVVIL